jgi:hypothetical protein
LIETFADPEDKPSKSIDPINIYVILFIKLVTQNKSEVLGSFFLEERKIPFIKFVLCVYLYTLF